MIKVMDISSSAAELQYISGVRCMMDHDEKILSFIARDEKISQRKLARLTDLSLGHLNLLLHKLVEKGLVKIEKTNPRNLRYVLTPQGIARNAKRAYKYIQDAVNQVLVLKEEVEQVFDIYCSKGGNVYIDGDNDEIYQLIKLVVDDKNPPNVVWLEESGQLP
jgi:predicted transcriptional regulator